MVILSAASRVVASCLLIRRWQWSCVRSASHYAPTRSPHCQPLRATPTQKEPPRQRRVRAEPAVSMFVFCGASALVHAALHAGCSCCACAVRARCEPSRTHPQPPLPTITCHPNPKGAPAAAAGAGRARCQHVCLLRCVRACACCVACWLQLLCVRSMLASLLACSRPRTNVPVIKTHPAFPPLCVSHWPQQKAVH